MFVVKWHTNGKGNYYVDGEVWREITVNEGDLIVLPKYESDTEIFNGWQVNGQGDALTGVYVANENTVFIANLRELAKLTFYVNNQVWKVGYADPGVVFFLPTVTDTVSYKFNGWKINGQGETLTNSCIVDEATVFVADITDTGKRLLTYIVDGGAWQTAEVDKNTATPLATVTDTKGRIFKGWKVNGTGDVYTNYTAQEDTVLVAHFACQVNFNNDGKITSREVDEGTKITLDKLEGNNKTFDGWQIDGAGSLLNGQYAVTKNTNFVTHYVCTVIFNNNGKITTKTVNAGAEITLETLPNTDTQGFMGWQIDGVGELLTDNFTVNSHTNFVANFADLDWVAYDIGLSFFGDDIWVDTLSQNFRKIVIGNKLYNVAGSYSNVKMQDVSGSFTHPDYTESNYGSLNENDMYGLCVWEANGKIYYSDGKRQWVMTEWNTWEKTTWKGLTDFYGYNIWSDGTNIYYSEHNEQYVLDSNNTWTVKTWNMNPKSGSRIWEKDGSTYYSCGTEQYVLQNGEWVVKNWGNDLTDFEGNHVWTDGTNYYYSYREQQYILQNGIWVEKTWVGNVPEFGACVWQDLHGCTYYSYNQTYRLVI